MNKKDCIFYNPHYPNECDKDDCSCNIFGKPINQNKMSNEELAKSITVLDQYVLVKQIMKAKNSNIILDTMKDDRDKFDFYFEVVQKGDKCERNFKTGDSPIFGEFVRFSGIKVIQKTNTLMVSLVVVHEGDIIAIDHEAKPIEIVNLEASVN